MRKCLGGCPVATALVVLLREQN